MKQRGISPIFSPLLHPSVLMDINNNLEDSGFTCLNPNSPDKLTIVHLLAGQNRAHFTVALALDENLEELPASSDSRLDDEKSKAVQKVFMASTIGEVLDSNTNHKLAYKKLSLLVHPDKNSHPGATEAFKKVQHAFTEFNNGNWADYPALQIEQAKPKTVGKPPKVVSVKTKTKKVSKITLFSEQALDLRASLTAFEEDVERLTGHVRDVLNENWERRDAGGGIPTPGGDTGIFVQMIKQVGQFSARI